MVAVLLGADHDYTLKLMINPGAVLLFLAFPLMAGAAGNNWMASRSGDLLLSQLSIPGSHDSGALYEFIPGTARCQSLSIAGQLNAGVRFLDVRCRHVGDAFSIYHGFVSQKQSFGDVLKAIIEFLDRNASETVIMSVKEEYDPSGNTRTFEQTFDSYVARNPSRWFLASGIPSLNQARGKIVLFRRFAASVTPKGIDASVWPDDATFTNGNLRVQDAYQVSNNDSKWSAITDLFEEARSGPANVLYVNFCSGFRATAGIPGIPVVSNEINRRLSAWLVAHPAQRYGVVLMDFADAGKCDLITKESPLRR